MVTSPSWSDPPVRVPIEVAITSPLVMLEKLSAEEPVTVILSEVSSLEASTEANASIKIIDFSSSATRVNCDPG